MELSLNSMRTQLQKNEHRMQRDADELRRLGAAAAAAGDDAAARKHLRRALFADHESLKLRDRLEQVEAKRNELRSLVDALELTRRVEAMNALFASMRAELPLERLAKAEAEKQEQYAYFEELESAVAASDAEVARRVERNRAIDLAAAKELEALNARSAAEARARALEEARARAAEAASGAAAAATAAAAAGGGDLQMPAAPTVVMDAETAAAAAAVLRMPAPPSAVLDSEAAAAAAAARREGEERVAVPA
jgi:colicin import membrane protein